MRPSPHTDDTDQVHSPPQITTSTMQWFLERGFEEVGVESLPESRRDIYNWQRKSKIYMKNLSTSRDLDAEELFWDVSPNTQ